MDDIVVCLKRVIELLNQVKNVSKEKGTEKLTLKLERTSIILRKDPILKDLVSNDDEELSLDVPPEVSDDEQELVSSDDERDWNKICQVVSMHWTLIESGNHICLSRLVAYTTTEQSLLMF